MVVWGDGGAFTGSGEADGRLRTLFSDIGNAIWTGGMCRGNNVGNRLRWRQGWRASLRECPGASKEGGQPEGLF